MISAGYECLQEAAQGPCLANQASAMKGLKGISALMELAGSLQMAVRGTSVHSSYGYTASLIWEGVHYIQAM